MGNLVSVGCKLPQGLILELGVSIVGGNVTRDAGYKRIELKGANQHAITEGPLRTPSPKDLRPGITNNVEEADFDAWMESHKDTNIVKNGLVFKAKNAGEATARANDLRQKSIGLEAVDPTKHPGLGKLTEGDGPAK